MKYSKVIKYILSLGAAAVLLFFSFRGVDWKEFNEGLATCRWEFVAMAMAASVAAFWFRAERWRILMMPFDRTLPSLATFNGVNIGYLANFVFPRIGEFVRCGFISRRSHFRHQDNKDEAITFDKALGTVLLSRTWDIVVVFLLLGLLLVARWQKFGEFFTRQMWEPAMERFDINLWWVIAAGAAFAVLFFCLIYILRNRNSFFRKVADFCKGILTGFESVLTMDHKARFFIYTILLWAMYWLMSMSIIWAMPQIEGLTWVDAWFVTLAGSVAWMIPVPGGFGAYHGIVALALSSIYSIDYGTGLLCATLNHEAQAITMLVFGSISYLIETFKEY